MSSTIKSTKNGKSGKSKRSTDHTRSQHSLIPDLRTPNPIEYQLSNGLFANLGWTVMPTKRSTRKIVQYQTQTAKPHLDWFQVYRFLGRRYYDEDKTKVLLDFDPDGSGRVYYPNGRLAIEVRRSKKRKRNGVDTITLYIVFTPGEKDLIGVRREPQIIAIFDSIGNGMVINDDGEMRLSYNQLGGIYIDTPVGIPHHWFWLKSPKKPELEIISDDPTADNLVREFFPGLNKSLSSSTGKETPNSIKNGSKKDKKGKAESKNSKSSDSGKEVFEEKVEESRIHDRRNINLQFLAIGKSIRIELGTKLDLNKEIARYNMDFSSLKTELLNCRFLKELENMISDNIHDLINAQLKAQKVGNSRSFMISKYKLFLPNSKRVHFS